VALSLGATGFMLPVQRTQARVAARAIAGHAAPGDVVVSCPDQIAVSLDRELEKRAAVRTIDQVAYPVVSPVDRIDWVDYRQRNKRANPGAFARMVLQRAGPHRIFLAWAPSYRTFGDDCHTLLADLRVARGNGNYVVHRRPRRYSEGMNVVALPALSQPASFQAAASP
jgi:hypothetical protein